MHYLSLDFILLSSLSSWITQIIIFVHKGFPEREGQKSTWVTDIAEWTGIGITACVRETEDQQEWREMGKSSKGPNSRQTLLCGDEGRGTNVEKSARCGNTRKENKREAKSTVERCSAAR